MGIDDAEGNGFNWIVTSVKQDRYLLPSVFAEACRQLCKDADEDAGICERTGQQVIDAVALIQFVSLGPLVRWLFKSQVKRR